MRNARRDMRNAEATEAPRADQSPASANPSRGHLPGFLT